MGWVAVCPTEELQDEEAVPFHHAGAPYVVFEADDGTVFCCAGACPVCDAPLAGAVLDGTVLECPADGAAFDLTDGTNEEDGPSLAVFQVRVVKGRIEAELPD